MRPEAAPPDQAALDLLTHADALALAAAEAIAAGDDMALAALLEERGIVVAAAVEALTQVMRAPPRPELMARLATATRSAVSTGAQVREAAQHARDEAAAALAVLDARNHAALEYQQGGTQATIDLKL